MELIEVPGISSVPKFAQFVAAERTGGFSVVGSSYRMTFIARGVRAWLFREIKKRPIFSDERCWPCWALTRF